MFVGLFEASVGGEDSGLKTEDGRPLFWVQVLKSGDVPDREIVITPKHIKSAVHQYQAHLEANPANYRRFDYLHNGAKRVQSIEDRAASGWVHSLESRDKNTELWALVDWTDKALKRITDREFRYVSSELLLSGEGKASFIGATLTNDPALLNLNALFEDDMAEENKDEVYEEGDKAPESELVELRKLRDILGLSPETSVLDVLEHLKALAKMHIEMEAKVPGPSQVVLERSHFEKIQRFEAELKELKAEGAFEAALKAHQILPSKKSIFIKLYRQDPALAEVVLYESGKFENLTTTLGITGEASPTYSSEGCPSPSEFGQASEEMAVWFESGKTEEDFENTNPQAYNIYRRGMTLGLRRG